MSEPTPSQAKPNMPSMFGRIARAYDPLNRILSLGLDQYWRKRLVQEALIPSATREASAQKSQQQHPIERIADIAAGTLDVTIALHKKAPHVRILALDICPPMLAIGIKKCKALQKKNPIHILPVTADAMTLPLKDASVDAITIAFGIRNMPVRSEVFAEMWRVLTPGGRVCILEFGSGKRRIWQGIYNTYLKRLLPCLGAWASGENAYAYLAKSILEFPEPEILAEELHAAHFTNLNYYPLTSGIVWIHLAEKPPKESPKESHEESNGAPHE